MLTFDEASHEYRWNGTRVPSVTQVLAQLTDLSKIPADVLERKRQIGTAVHLAIELHLLNELDPDSLDEACIPYFDAFLKFMSESGFVVEHSERQLYSEKYRFAGTADLAGTFPKTGPALIDTKCTATLYPTVGPQVAAYAELAGTPRIKRYALQLCPDSTYRLDPLEDKGDWSIFHAALTLHHWRQRNV